MEIDLQLEYQVYLVAMDGPGLWRFDEVKSFECLARPLSGDRIRALVQQGAAQRVGVLAAQEEIGREMTRLQAADQEILAKIPAPPPLSPPAAPTRKPPSVPPQRAPTTSLTPHP